MKRWMRRVALLVVLLWSLGGGWAIATPLSTPSSADVYADVYTYRNLHNPDGIGKVYLGREIAQVMGYRGAAWLERPSRLNDEKPDRVLQALALQPTDVVADIGAGTGYFSFRISPLVPQGRVLAVDVQPEMLDILQFMKAENHAENVEPILASPTDPHLIPNSIDLALMVDVYHELEFPQEVMQKVVAALKPGGRVVLIEYRGENPFIPIKALHKMTQKQVKKEMQAVGLTWQETQEFLPQQHFIVFKK